MRLIAALQISSCPTGLSLTRAVFFRERLARGLHSFSSVRRV
jgi:hypothetical protein